VSFKALKVRTNLTETNWKTFAKVIDQVALLRANSFFQK